MKRLVHYLKDYKVESILSPLFKMLEAIFELLVPIVMAKMIDIGIKNRDLNYILTMGLVLLLLGVVGLTCSITAQFFAAKAAVGFGTELRRDLFGHINSLSYTEIDKVGTSTLVTRMTNDINQVQTAVNMVLRLFLRSPFIVFGAMIMAFTINVKAALIFVVTIPILTVIIFGIMFVTMPLYRRVQGMVDRILLLTRENLTGARVVRVFHKQEQERATFDESNGALVALQKFTGKISALLNPSTYIVINVATIVLLWTGAVQVDSSQITQGQLVALVNYMSQILIELIKLANLIVSITKSFACAKRINDVFDLNTSIIDGSQIPDSKTEEKVVFDHVSFRYDGAGGDSLKDISFEAKKGDVIGIIGGTGCGKSTLVNVLARFYDATQGQVRIDGIDVKETKEAYLRSHIGIVPQKAALFKGTIRENMCWGKKDASDMEITEALMVSQAEEIVDKKGLEYMINTGASNLSGGQKQRLTIARALVKKPDILILDDSASALDFATDARLRKAIQENLKGITTFIVSQRVASIMNADQILVLDEGRLAGKGTHHELLENCAIYQEICYSQLSKDEVNKNGK